MDVLHHLPMWPLSLGGLSTEQTMLGLAALLGLFQLMIAARTGNRQRGLKWNLSARDEAPPAVGAVAGRLERAYRNFMETFPFFAVSVILLSAEARHSWATVWGSETYLTARVVYLPLYGFGVPGVRTLVWLIALLAILLLYAAVFVPGL